MKNQILSAVKKYNMLNMGDGVVAGLSGGADSVSLLAVLKEIAPIYNLRLCAVHLNHCIRGEEAQRDEDFSRQLCKAMDIELIVFKRQVLKEAEELGISLEEAGRKIRYELFNQVLEEKGYNKIAVAHNMNDNAETVLMRLCRGTGIKGLGGIAPVRGNIIRPLIETDRSEIEDYCRKNNLSYCIDSTNLSEDYTRNKVRLSLIPWLKENLNPSVCEGINKTAQLMRQEDEYLDSLAEAAYRECLADKNALCISKFKAYPLVIRRRVVRLLFSEFIKSLKDISAEHIEAVCALVENKSGASLSLPYSLKAKREYDLLILEQAKEENKGYCYNLKLNEELYIKEIDAFVAIYEKKKEIEGNLLYTNCFNCDIIYCGLCLRTRNKGDIIHLKGVGTKKLKRLFSDMKTGRDKRDTIPLLAFENQVLWVGTKPYRVNDKYISDKGVYFYIWRKDN